MKGPLSSLCCLIGGVALGCSDTAGEAPVGSSMSMTNGGLASTNTAAVITSATTSSQSAVTTGSSASASDATGSTTMTASASSGAGGASVSGTTVSASSGGAGTGTESSSTGVSGAGGTSTGAGSSGCGKQAEQATGEWVQQAPLNVQGTERAWATYLPDGYDPSRAYPLVIQLHGCTSGTNNVPVERVSGEDAVHVRGTGSAANTCWETGANGSDVEFFDAMLAEATSQTCIDETRVFASGYSSGSWLISVLACIRGDRLRAVGTVAGGNALFGNPECPGTVAQIFIHDQNDTENPWSNHESAMARLIDANGCSADDPVAEPPEPCVRFQGCSENPVKFCPTTGRGHDRQDNYAPQAFWDFFSEL